MHIHTFIKKTIKALIIQYDTIEEFNVDWKAEWGLLNLVHATKNKKNIIYKKEETKTTNASVH